MTSNYNSENGTTKVHKVTLFIVDHDDINVNGVVSALENTCYPNRCIRPHVMSIETKEVEWDDEHPLNSIANKKSAFSELFKP